MFTDFYHGDSKNIRLNITDNDKVPIDMTGWVFEVIVRDSLYVRPEDADIHMTFFAGDHPEDDAENGKVVITIPSTKVSALEPNKPYFITLRYIHSDDQAFVIGEDRISVMGFRP